MVGLFLITYVLLLKGRLRSVAGRLAAAAVMVIAGLLVISYVK